MLRACSPNSFYLDEELVDVNWLDWGCRIPNGARIHKRKQAITKLKLVAESLLVGCDDGTTENLIYKWLQEAK